MAGKQIKQPAYWAAQITASWQRSLNAIIETGRLLIAAKEGEGRLAHGESLNLIRKHRPFGERVAQCLVKIAQDERLTSVKYPSLLPHMDNPVRVDQARASFSARVPLTAQTGVRIPVGLGAGLFCAMSRGDRALICDRAPRAGGPTLGDGFYSPFVWCFCRGR